MTLTAQAALFKSEVVKMLDSGQTAAYISKTLGVSENLIYRWKNQNRDGCPARGKKSK
ncbi:transposase [Spirosoma utsteinense]|uniref:Transposase-like protein n=1 Tax=Spirosoma utsteinense TaxID=2585773 RepID=A0ABR6W6G4_9BACT|nr:helix-turn-helix domain-containing protein [Spirosoma utsteinense]MBC3787933.1 transposase-like protein [Spirosoma utsteinense]MBC3792144.1 transposase-like protein [Spirosoma utsteinense]